MSQSFYPRGFIKRTLVNLKVGESFIFSGKSHARDIMHSYNKLLAPMRFSCKFDKEVGYTITREA